MDSEKILSRLVQMGTVSALDRPRNLVRVILGETGHASGWLRPLASCGGLEVNQQVLVLYLPVFNGDGFILGVV